MVGEELRKWGARGVGGHFEGTLAWARCEETLPPLMAELVGAKDANRARTLFQDGRKKVLLVTERAHV